jgi:hypothetical protein
MLASITASCNKEKVILFPAYCCWSMSAPFEKSGWIVKYYRLNEDLTVDLDYLKKLLSTIKVNAVLTMNFFGCTNTDDAVQTIKEFDDKINVIEDFTHCLFSFKQIFNSNVDIYVSSIRKSIGVCDGAIILSKKAIPHSYVCTKQLEFCNRRFKAQTNKWQYSFSKDFDKKNTFINELHACEDILDNFSAIHSMSEQGREMLSFINGSKIAYARRENMAHIMSLLKGKVKMLEGLDRCLNGAPFSLPILVDNQIEIQKMLAKQGVYAPVLWPLCKRASQLCNNSSYIAEHMLSIPIDQRYTYDDIEDIAKILLNVLK